MFFILDFLSCFLFFMTIFLDIVEFDKFFFLLLYNIGVFFLDSWIFFLLVISIFWGRVFLEWRDKVFLIFFFIKLLSILLILFNWILEKFELVWDRVLEIFGEIWGEMFIDLKGLIFFLLVFK